MEQAEKMDAGMWQTLFLIKFLLMTYSYRSTCYLFHASPPPLAGSG